MKWQEVDYYYVDCAQWKEDICVALYGFSVKKDKNKVFTVDMANELINLAKRKYAEECGGVADFNTVYFDTSDYYEDVENVLDDGKCHPMRIFGKKKTATYDKRNHLLQMFEDGILINKKEI